MTSYRFYQVKPSSRNSEFKAVKRTFKFSMTIPLKKLVDFIILKNSYLPKIKCDLFDFISEPYSFHLDVLLYC